MSEEEQDRNALVESYASKFGEPRYPQEAYGYWMFAAGTVLGILGLVMLAASVTPEPRSAEAFSRRGIAAVLGGVGLPLLMVGVVYRLPVNRKVDKVALLGGAVCFVGVAAFYTFYPANWNVAADSDAADHSVLVSGVYGVGLLIIAVAALVLPMVTEAKEAVEEAAPAKSKAKFQMYKDKAGEWRWTLRHQNGNIIADSSEGYSSKGNMKKGMESVRKNAPAAETQELDEPPEGSRRPRKKKDESKAEFELYEDEGGDWRWRLRHDNGNIIADSAEGYSSKAKAKQGMESVKKNAGGADVQES